MKRDIDKILEYPIRAQKEQGAEETAPMRKKQLTILDVVFLLCLLAISLQMRQALFPFISGDFAGALEPWMKTIREFGGLASLKYEISNYSSAYMILMSLLSYIPLEPLYLLKYLSVFFDYAAGLFIFLILFELTGHKRKAILGMAGFLLAPTVMMNSALWSQCDIIYTSFLLLGFYYYLRGSSGRTFFFTSIGFAFKLQALFILPFYIILWLCPYITAKGEQRKIYLRDFWMLPIPYLILALPGILMGRDAWNSIGVYFNQFGYYTTLTMSYPNLYAFFGQTQGSAYSIPELGTAGIYMTVLLLGCLAYYLYGKKVRMKQQVMITTMLFSLCLITYCLPHMHERYGFPIDVIAVLYGVLRPRKIPIAIGLIVSSLIAYMPFLFGKEGLPPLVHGLFQLGLILAVGMDLYHQTHNGSVSQSKNPLV